MNLEPPSDRVILRPHDPETETAFGLAIPETAQGKSQYATVLAVGEGYRHPTNPKVTIGLGWHRCGGIDGPAHGRQLHPGDVVLMPAFNGTEIDYDGETVISILASELLAVVA